MNWFAKRPSLLVLVFLLGGAAGSAAKEKVKKDETPKKGGSFSVPIPTGHGGNGITVPYFGTDGRKQMDFHIDKAMRTDDRHLSMKNLRVETYTDTGATEMLIDMPVSVLDLETRIISSERPVLIRRSDFEIVGEAMEFNTATKTARINGKTRMLVFDQKEFQTQ